MKHIEKSQNTEAVLPVLFKLVNWLGIDGFPKRFTNKQLLTPQLVEAVNKNCALLVPLLALHDPDLLKRFMESIHYQALLLPNRFVFSSVLDALQSKLGRCIHVEKIYPDTKNTAQYHLNAVIDNVYSVLNEKLPMKETMGWEFKWSGE